MASQVFSKFLIKNIEIKDDALVEFMQTHSDIARGFAKGGRTDVGNQWKDLVTELNSLVWACWKTAIKKNIFTNKKKLLQHVEPIQTIVYTKQEEVVGRISGLYANVDGIISSVSPGYKSNSSESSPSEKSFNAQPNTPKRVS